MGPRWLGIGVQRCGTSWFDRLLRQHPLLTLSAAGEKEVKSLQHTVDQGLTDGRARRYLELFSVSGLPGEFAPSYLRCLWVAPIVREICPPEIPLIVLLRDPVERFESAIRLAVREGLRRLCLTRFAAEAQWAGMYATQLAAWERVVGTERMMVFQYERFIENPEGAIRQVWDRLELEPVRLDLSEPPDRSSEWRMDDSLPEMRELLGEVYRAESARLVRWGIDPDLWRSFNSPGRYARNVDAAEPEPERGLEDQPWGSHG